MVSKNSTPEEFATYAKSGHVQELWALLSADEHALLELLLLERPRWLLDLMLDDLGAWEKLLTEEAQILYACEDIEELLPYFDAVYPDDPRPRHAIEAARRFAAGGSASMLSDAHQQAQEAKNEAREAITKLKEEKPSSAVRLAKLNIAEHVSFLAALVSSTGSRRLALPSGHKNFIGSYTYHISYQTVFEPFGVPTLVEAMAAVKKKHEDEVAAGVQRGRLTFFPAVLPSQEAEQKAEQEASEARQRAEQAYLTRNAERLIKYLRGGSFVSLSVQTPPEQLAKLALNGHLRSVWSLLCAQDFARLREIEAEQAGWLKEAITSKLEGWLPLLPEKELRGFVMRCAVRALPAIETFFPNEKRPRALLQTYAAFAENKATQAQLTQAEEEAHDAHELYKEANEPPPLEAQGKYSGPPKVPTHSGMPRRYQRLLGGGAFKQKNPTLEPARIACRAVLFCVEPQVELVQKGPSWAATACSYQENRELYRVALEGKSDVRAAWDAFQEAHHRSLHQEAGWQAGLLLSILAEENPALRELYPAEMNPALA